MMEGRDVSAKSARAQIVKRAARRLVRNARDGRRQARNNRLRLRLPQHTQTYGGGYEITRKRCNEPIERRTQRQAMGGKRCGETNRIGFVRAYRLDRVVEFYARPCHLRGGKEPAALLQRLKAALFRWRQRDRQLCNVRQLD